jgi:hypothetical protein
MALTSLPALFLRLSAWKSSFDMGVSKVNYLASRVLVHH